MIWRWTAVGRERYPVFDRVTRVAVNAAILAVCVYVLIVTVKQYWQYFDPDSLSITVAEKSLAVLMMSAATALVLCPVLRRPWRAIVSINAGILLFSPILLMEPLLRPDSPAIGLPAAMSEYDQILADHVGKGQRIGVNYAPISFLDSRSAPITTKLGGVYPLSAGISNARTLMCREGKRPYILYDSDRYGFHNPDFVWNAEARYLLVGDSFTYGACVQPEDHFVAMLRMRDSRTVNLGLGGNGPLVELGTLREYGPSARPAVVFWIYDDANDLYYAATGVRSDLDREMRHPVIRRYIEPEFSQKLVFQADAIASALEGKVSSHVSALLSKYERKPTPPSGAFDAWMAGLWVTAPNVAIALRQLQIRLFPPDGDELVELFARILRVAKQDAASWGGRLVFVNLPFLWRICHESHIRLPRRHLAMKDALWRTLPSLGLDIIDLEDDYRTLLKHYPRELIEAETGCGGHIGEAGYRVVGDRLIEYLDIVEKGTSLPPGWTRSSADVLLSYKGNGRLVPFDAARAAGGQ